MTSFPLTTRIATLTAFHMVLLGGMLPHAEGRSWRSMNGNQSFRAVFVSSNGVSVVLRTPDRRTVTVALKNLHSSDRAWVRQHLKKTLPPAEAGVTGPCFDSLAYGDTRATVEKKLRESPAVSKTLDDQLIGRTGLNGIYRTTVAGEQFNLFFQWSGNDELREVTLRGESSSSLDYDKGLRKRWQSLLSKLARSHGSPVQATRYPPREELTGGQLLGSHLWHTENGHSILLCTGQEKDNYLVAVRFSADRIPPNVLPELPAETPADPPPGP